VLAEAGTVLLKNNMGILPIQSSVKTIAVIGDDGNDHTIVAGGGSGGVRSPYIVTPLQGIKTRAGSGVTVSYANSASTANAATLARGADIAIVFVSQTSSEGGDRGNLMLPNNQDALVQAVVAAQPNTVVVVHTPGAVLLPWANSVKGIVCAFLPGQESGNAIASVLFGDVNPSGKLPLTFPVAQNDWFSGDSAQYPGTNGQVIYSEKLNVGYRWYDSKNINPLFPFGHGLSYTMFNYTNLRVMGSPPTVSVDIQNSGKVAGSEVAQLYLAFPAAAGEPPKILRGFQKLMINPGDKQTANFKLAAQDISMWDISRSQWTQVRGSFNALVGSSSRDIRASGMFTV